MKKIHKKGLYGYIENPINLTKEEYKHLQNYIDYLIKVYSCDETSLQAMIDIFKVK